MKISNQKGYADWAIILLVAIVLMLGIFLFIQIDNSSNDESEIQNTSLESEESPQNSALVDTEPEDYIFSAKQPGDWVTVSDSKYSFGFSHPSNWKVVFDTKANPELFKYEVGMGESQQAFDAIIGLVDGNLASVATNYKATFIENGGVSLISERNILFNGEAGYEIVYEQSDGTQEIQYFIVLGESGVLQMPVVYPVDPVGGNITAEESLQLIESLNFM